MEPVSRHPSQLLRQLRALFEPEGWLLAENSEVLEHHGLTLAQAPHALEPGHWQHNQQLSWLALEQAGRRYLIGLSLADDLSREVTQSYLQHLEPALPQPRPTNALRQARAQGFIRHAFEHMPDGIIVTDQLGVIVFANHHIERWFHEPMPSLGGMPLATLLQGHDPREQPPWHETVSDTLTQQESRTVDLTLHGKDFLIHFAPFTLPENHQPGIVANISDITELRQQQRQHREAIDFISHDVRSPLVSQLALIEQMKRAPEHIDTGQIEQLGRLARRSYHLAEEFVQLARAEQLSEARFYDCELLAIVENARDSVCEQALEKDIALQLQGTEDLWLNGNAELLERAVINLLTNAVQYSPAHSCIIIDVYRAGHLACLTVADEGMGIAPEELPYLFERYHRQKSSELAGQHGTGLGLSFVRTVIEKHRGDISVDSRPNEGATFTLKVPIANPMV
ncbi:MAG: PAS domain-containing sensor histidine kinase [Alteromonadaceae bacterium]|nr:PAS domain-containing sensor histidine kinase [Alteromonadaceae bacterium]